MKLLCTDCGDRKTGPFYNDPRDPPLEEFQCLCQDCYENALVQCVEDVEEELSDLRENLKKIRRKK